MSDPGTGLPSNPSLPAGIAFSVKPGRSTIVSNGMVLGHTKSTAMKLDGGFSEQVVVPARNLIPLADQVSFEAGSFIANLGTIVYAMRRTGLQPGMNVLVFGTGANGLILAELSKKTGASTVVVTGRTKSRLEVASRMGIDETVLADDHQEETLRRIAPRGFDAIFETTGAVPIVERAFKFVTPGRENYHLWYCAARPERPGEPL